MDVLSRDVLVGHGDPDPEDFQVAEQQRIEANLISACADGSRLHSWEWETPTMLKCENCETREVVNP